MRLGPLTFAIAAAFLPAPAPAQEYPSRPVLFVVPYAAGGGTETMARLLGRRLEQRLGKPFVIDNRPGAGTAIGATFVAKSAPDGHTILLATSTTLAINVSIYRSLAYDPLKDLSSPTIRSSSWSIRRCRCIRSRTWSRSPTAPRAGSPMHRTAMAAPVISTPSC
jgi:tripartite-type tricarboxylate transporter receptor subunit TctC